jgi:small-conductance mechanosensitive channel
MRHLSFAHALLAQVAPPPVRWAERWHELESIISAHLGPWVKVQVFPGVTWFQLLSVILILTGTLIVGLLIRIKARRELAKPSASASLGPGGAGAPANAAVPSWFKLTLQQAQPPLVLLLWVWGGYCALRILIFRFRSNGGLILPALNWAKTVGLGLVVFWFLFRMINVVEVELKRWASRTTAKWDDILAAVMVRAMRLVLPLIGAMIVLPTLDIPAADHALLQTAASLALIAFIGFMCCELIATAEKAVIAEYRVDVRDNLETRKIQTQVQILKKIAVALVILITAALMLMVFEPVRSLGKSILASAGVAGIVIGIAAQRSLATLLAGIQIAFTQPIRLDDVVVVETEWGRIEEITLTYVVVALWDKRRLVLPITYFLEKPFQNWTRSSSDLLGSVFLYLDYTAPIPALRAELDRLLAQSARWDQKTKALQVTDAKDHTIEVRILASAADSGTAFDLRCEIREGLIDFLQRHHPEALPKTRANVRLDQPPPNPQDARQLR